MTPAEKIRAKFDELYEANPRMGVTLKELDVALVADGDVFEPEAISEAVDGLRICTVKDAQGVTLRRCGFNVWEPTREAA